LGGECFLTRKVRGLPGEEGKEEREQEEEKNYMGPKST
jgi:hypothetical protein